MKHLTVFYFWLLSLVLLPAMAQQVDNRLWYTRPASDWNEALPVGNGRMGAMIYGGIQQEIIQINEESLWGGVRQEADAAAADSMPRLKQLLLDGRIGEAVALSEKVLRSDPLRIRSYQSLGELVIDFPKNHRTENYRRELNLPEGIASVSYQAGGTGYTREVFLSAPDNMLVVHFKANRPGGLTFRMQFRRQQDATAVTLNDRTVGVSGQVFDLPANNCGLPGLHMRFAARIEGSNCGGEMKSASGSFYVEQADEATFRITAATDYDFDRLDLNPQIHPEKVCKDILAQSAGYDYKMLRSRHIADHQSIFDRVDFAMGKPSPLSTDERLMRVQKGESDLGLITLYFQYGRYLLMNSSRFPRRLPANLQGVWNQDMDAAWSSDFHTNINIQMNYWPAEICNLSETVEPFSAFIDRLRVPGRVTAKKTYGAQGWTMNHLTDPFGHTAISDGVGWGTFPIAGPWLTLHQWEHYRFTRDHKYLKEEAYPSMREAAEFLLDFMVKDKDGLLVTAPSNSPENAYRLPDGQAF